MANWARVPSPGLAVDCDDLRRLISSLVVFSFLFFFFLSCRMYGPVVNIIPEELMATIKRRGLVNSESPLVMQLLQR